MTCSMLALPAPTHLSSMAASRIHPYLIKGNRTMNEDSEIPSLQHGEGERPTSGLPILTLLLHGDQGKLSLPLPCGWDLRAPLGEIPLAKEVGWRVTGGLNGKVTNV
ncbi:hypothetical protein DR999_PMT14192 [Platysternon megacephalum]|uniref:Uncharacterized protein n=1 Tax=Platysternon megacephalum TaxID=55544 RepID=A0A4D9E981_9SAUR|nr:hypothetical protein DR999_PMT14192 [Platysternon megacephalum]